MSLAYTSVARILDEEPKIGSASTITSAQLYQYAEGGEAIIDACIVRHYSLPVSSGVGHVPLLTAIATDIGVYRTLRRVMTGEHLKASGWPDKFKESLETLNEVANGKKILVDSGYTIIAARTDVAEVYSDTMDYHPTFSELPPSLSFLDEDKVDDLLDARDIGLLRTLLK